MYFDCVHIKSCRSAWNFFTHPLHWNLQYVISIIISIKCINEVSAITIFVCKTFVNFVFLISSNLSVETLEQGVKYDQS